MADLDRTLIVPVDLAALCVGDTDVNGSDTNPYGTKDFARLSPDFSLLPYAAGGVAHNSGPYLSSQIMAATFQDAAPALKPGIHLHWALPEAVTRGAQHSDGTIRFPRTPDRWLILRIATCLTNPAAPATALKAWILESDRLTDSASGTGALPQNQLSRSTPIRPDPMAQPNQSWRVLGRVFDYQGWAEDPAAPRAALTALGFGDPGFAASYQLCPNVFGFWDLLEDLDPFLFPPGHSRVSYMLMGWHADAADDPMTRITYPPDASYDEKLALIAATYGWSFAPDVAHSIPTRTAYNALLTDIPWNRQVHYIDKRRPTPDFQVAVGNTTPEALSAVLAAQPALRDEPKIEMILNALQLGLLSRLQLPGGLRRIDEAIHQAGFAAASAGTHWVVEPAMDDESITAPAHRRRLAPARLQNLPDGLHAALNELNVAQAELDRLAQNIDSLRGQIFADWCNYMQMEYGPVPPTGDAVTPDQARGFITMEVDLLNGLIAEQSTQSDRVARHREVVQALLTPDFQLTGTDGPRFWSPTDPVVLFSGTDVKPPDRYAATGASDGDGNRVCRLGANAISALLAAAGSATLDLGATALPRLAPNPSVPIAATQAALIGEAFFLDPVQSPVLAASIAAMGGPDNPAIADFPAFRAAVEAAQRALFVPPLAASAGAPVSFAGRPPVRAAARAWTKPWIPIILQWRIEHFPNARPPYAAYLVTANYDFDAGDIDLVFKYPIPVIGGDSCSYDGTILLTHDTEINIRQQISEFLANFPDSDYDEELREILTRMKLSMQAQSLSGFNQGFVQLARILQMEVTDPLAILKGRLFADFTNRLVKGAVGAMNTASPLVNTSFSPLRSGGFRIAQVRIIDAFGQTLDLDAPDVIRSENLVPPQETAPLINLPLRVTQPIELDFRWLAAASDQIETNSAPATTPIFGWVLYNHLDHALMIYDTHGIALGSFNMRGPFWQGAPGNQAAYGRTVTEVFADADPHLRDFALGVAHSADPAGYLTEILRSIDRSVAFIAPSAENASESLSVLIGRPLALARAGLDIHGQGLPAVDQSRAAFEVAIRSGDPMNRGTGHAPSVRLPVRLGDLSDLDDGLVGYFIDDGGPDAYRRFYSPAASQGDRHGVRLPAFDQIALTTAPGSGRVMISMLLDPNAAIHATMGALPMKKLTIPATMITDGMQRIAVTFLTTPILGSGTAQMPAPEESGYTWTWVTQTEGAGQWTITPLTDGHALSLLDQQIEEGWLKLQHAPDKAAAAGHQEE